MPIQLVELRHHFRDLVALDQVSLHVRDGDCYGFTGHNGAGKTTALRITLGLLPPAAGRVFIAGHDAVRNPRVRTLLGGLVEQPGFHDGRSGPANLRMLAALQGIPAGEHDAEVERVLALVGLADVGDKRVGHYSQGMRQRLGLAQALLGQPRYLVLDEPTNGLDPQGIHELRVLLVGLAHRANLTILLSSHLLTEVAELCNRIGILIRGRMLVEATTAELLDASRFRFYRLHTDDDAAAQRLLTGLAVPATATPAGLQVEVGGRPPADLVDALVAAGCRVHAFAPIEASLEQIYLEYTRGERDPTAAPAAAPAATPSPLPRLTTGTAIARVMGYEWRRLRRPATALALAIPPVVAALVVYQRHLGLALAAEQVAGGTLHTATRVTAFEALGRALAAGLPLLALVAAGLASQSVAGELRGGTLRNLLMRPFHRLEVAVGKLAVLLLTTLGAYLVLVAVAATSAGVAFEYGDLVELLATGARYEHLKAEEVWPELWPALASPVLPLLAFGALGFLCGTLTRTATGALALTLGVVTGMELGRGFARAWQLEGGLLGPYLPSPLSRGSHIDYFVDVAGGVSRQAFAFAATTPAIYLVTCAVFAGMILRRKYVP